MTSDEDKLGAPDCPKCKGAGYRVGEHTVPEAPHKRFYRVRCECVMKRMWQTPEEET